MRGYPGGAELPTKGHYILLEFFLVAKTVNAGTIRSRTIRVGKRLEKHRDEVVASPSDTTPAVKEVVIGLDGGYVKGCHRRPERKFEVIVGKVIGLDDASTRLAFVRGTGKKEEGRRYVT